MNIPRGLIKEDFKVEAKTGTNKVRVRVIKKDRLEGSRTKQVFRELEVKNHGVLSDVRKDILKIALIERNKATGNIGRGFVSGFGLKRGSIASSVAHDHHNVVVGTNDEDMVYAVNKLAEVGGGLVNVVDGAVVSLVELSSAGLMSEEPAGVVAAKLEEFNYSIGNLSCQLPSQADQDQLSWMSSMRCRSSISLKKD